MIIADGECQLARQRRVRAEDADKLKRGERVVRARYGVDDEICTGDHSCIRLSGCPSLTVKPNPDPLRTDPVATVIESCVGCGLCGEVAHAAVLCPSFYRAEIDPQPDLVGPLCIYRLRRTVIGWFGRRRLARMSRAMTRPLTLLIAALGGEGGGVLTNWIIAAAAELRLPGADRPRSPASRSAPAPPPTTSRSCPTPWRELGGRRPVLALTPGIGDIDIVVASELMEAGRAIANGFVTPDRTLLIASTSRFYRDEREDRDGRRPLRQRAPAQGDRARTRRRASCSTWRRSRRQSGAMINAVMLGAIAGCGTSADPGRGVRGGDPRRRQGGRRAICAASAPGLPPRARGSAVAGARGRQARAAGRDDVALDSSARSRATHAGSRRSDIVIEGVRRLAAYQDASLCAAAISIGSRPCATPMTRAGADGQLLRETARHLAVRMSFEDVIRVAQAKIDPARMQRIAEELSVKPGEPYRGHRVPQARHRGNVPDAAAVRWRAASSATRSGAAGSTACISAWRSRPPRSPAICASGCWRSCAAGGRAAIATSEEQAAIEAWLA